jgi:outer membrane protein assembly factor BamB
MNNLLKSIIAFAIVAIVFASCGKVDNPILPTPDPENGAHPQLWSYDFGIASLTDITPAIDENDNVYFSMSEQDGSSNVVIALDKSGTELWKKTFTGSSASKVIYADNRVFVSGSDPSAVYCLNAGSGNTEWEHDFNSEYNFFGTPAIAFANNRLYISVIELIESYLMAFDISGNEVWKKSVENAGLNISVSGNSLFFRSYTAPGILLNFGLDAI